MLDLNLRDQIAKLIKAKNPEMAWDACVKQATSRIEEIEKQNSKS